MSAIVTAIDAVQAFNEAVVSHRQIKAPCLADYPPTTDSARTPMMLTRAETITFNGQFTDRATIELACEMLYKPLGQGHFGDTMHRIHEAMDDLRQRYTDETAYQVVGRRILATNPQMVEIVSTFTFSGYRVIEYPLGSEMWYHGFDLRFTVETNEAC